MEQQTHNELTYRELMDLPAEKSYRVWYTSMTGERKVMVEVDELPNNLVRVRFGWCAPFISKSFGMAHNWINWYFKAYKQDALEIEEIM